MPMQITLVMDGVHLHARACTLADVSAFPDFGNGTDCAGLWCVVKGLLATRSTRITSGAHCTFERAYPPFYVSVTAGWSVL